MEAIILAGGFGTRLSHIVTDVPKPMAPVKNKPFLEYIMEYLIVQGITKVILATGFKSEVISDYFGNSYKGLRILYSKEESPLGTGGALKKAIALCESDYIFIINGDTYFDVSLKDMMMFHLGEKASITISAKKMFNYSRYGTLLCKDSLVNAFQEKRLTEEGLINGGIYLLNKSILDNIDKDVFSLEKDVFEAQIECIRIVAYESNGYFIDIGIPEDYYKAQEVFN